MFRTTLLSWTLCAAAIPAQAATLVYDTFSSYPYWVWGSGGLETSNGGEIGASFSPFETGRLSELSIAIGTTSNPATTAVTFHVRADAGGTPGSPIESFFVAGEIPLQSEEVGPFLLTSADTPLLEAGQTYWLTVETDQTSDVIWHGANWTFDEYPSWIGNQAIRFPGSSTFFVGGKIASAFQVYVDVVPTPPAVWLFGSALGVMGWARRKTAEAIG
ncbi:MAG: choice-of-anchor R domain-containing protein [Gammaproteobacteria bacterium]